MTFMTYDERAEWRKRVSMWRNLTMRLGVALIIESIAIITMVLVR